MKKYVVIGNPIEHSLSPKLHNYWIKNYNLNATYEKKKLEENELESFVSKIKEGTVHGINVTVPFKKTVIPYLDQLSVEAKNTQSVNTIYLNNKKVVGHNTDIGGFELGIKNIKFNPTDKKIIILGAGGVVPSIIFALSKMNVSTITVSNRTKKKAENLKNLFKNLKIADWGDLPDFDIIINATSLGLKKDDDIKIDFSNVGQNKLFYDVIYNPRETNFLKIAKKLGNKAENGKLMFVYQAFLAFKVWHGISPEINEELIKFLD